MTMKILPCMSSRWMVEKQESWSLTKIPLPVTPWRPDGKQIAFLAKQKPDAKEKELKSKGFDAEIYEEQLTFTHNLADRYGL